MRKLGSYSTNCLTRYFENKIDSDVHKCDILDLPRGARVGMVNMFAIKEWGEGLKLYLCADLARHFWFPLQEV